MGQEIGWCCCWCWWKVMMGRGYKTGKGRHCHCVRDRADGVANACINPPCGGDRDLIGNISKARTSRSWWNMIETEDAVCRLQGCPQGRMATKLKASILCIFSSEPLSSIGTCQTPTAMLNHITSSIRIHLIITLPIFLSTTTRAWCSIFVQ